MALRPRGIPMAPSATKDEYCARDQTWGLTGPGISPASCCGTTEGLRNAPDDASDRYCLLPRALALRSDACCGRRYSPADEPDFDAAHRAAIATNPPGVTLTLAIDPTAKQLHIGEPLPMKLTFAFHDPKPFEFNDCAYKPDRDRLIDLFYVTPAVSLRSLESRYGNQDQGFLGSPSGFDLRKAAAGPASGRPERIIAVSTGRENIACIARAGVSGRSARARLSASL